MKRITIFGGGATGTLLVVNLIKHAAANEPLEINLIEREQMRGRSASYSATEAFHLLNVPAAKMGAFPDDVEHFHHWLGENHYDFAPNDFVSRRIYGDYLRDLLRKNVEEKPSNMSFNAYGDEAIDIAPNADGAEVLLKSGASVASDRVLSSVRKLCAAASEVGKYKFH